MVIFMKYHKGKRFGLCEKVQSLIYWQCVNFESLEKERQEHVRNLCAQIAGIYSNVLFEAVTSTVPVTTISYRTLTTNTPIYDSHLCVMVKKFYKEYAHAYNMDIN